MSFFGFGLASQRTTEEGIQMLTENQQDELTLATAAATTQAERNTIISNKLIEFAAADKASADAANMKIYIATGGVAIVLLIGLLIYWRKE